MVGELIPVLNRADMATSAAACANCNDAAAPTPGELLNWASVIDTKTRE
ncbi:hypothetical protein [Arthrobacter castelli]|nr:hypothetical protein [Arthrobacter castelli]